MVRFSIRFRFGVRIIVKDWIRVRVVYKVGVTFSLSLQW